MSIARGWTEADLLGYPARFFIQSVSKPVYYTLYNDLTSGQKGYAQYHVALHSQLPSFRSVLHGRL